MSHKNITRYYKRTDEDVVARITPEATGIATKLGLQNCLTDNVKQETLLSAKYHKPNFANNHSCRLNNTIKSELGIVNKNILNRINEHVFEKVNVYTWGSTTTVLNWFVLQHVRTCLASQAFSVFICYCNLKFANSKYSFLCYNP